MAYPGYGSPPGIYAPPIPPTPSYTSPVNIAGSGYPTSTYAVAPPDADPQLWDWFHASGVHRSGEITIVELQRALDNGDWKPFDVDTIKLLIQLFDTDRNGYIGFREFAAIWRYIKDWQNAFRHFDRDRSDTIDTRELRDALAQFGYRLTPHLIELIERKYALPATYTVGPPPGITFDRFVRACVAVKQITETFKRQDTNSDGWIQIDYDGFMEIVLSLP